MAFAVRTDETLTADAVVAVCRGQIVNYKLPKEVHFLAMEELPGSRSGKIQRHVLEGRLVYEDNGEPIPVRFYTIGEGVRYLIGAPSGNCQPITLSP